MVGKTIGLRRGLVLAGVVAVVLATGGRARGDPSADDAEMAKKLKMMEERLNAQEEQIAKLKLEQSNKRLSAAHTAEIKKLIKEMNDDAAKHSKMLDADSWVHKLTIGGYGEMHANFGEGGGADQFDIHRVVLYAGYEFADWIRLSSEIEVEHALVTSGAGGEVTVEQLFVDIDLLKQLTLRVGRILTPLGIINKKHEPTSFHGVERPPFAKYIIPSTWSSDGIGALGKLLPQLKYELYAVGGLDGSGFSAKDGIRGGRQKERPGLHEPAVTGRLDWFPLARRKAPYGQTLRVGVSGYAGGVDNANRGNQPGVNGEVYIASADAEYSIRRFDFRGAIAHITIDGATEMGSGTAEQILGWYVEGAYHFLPESYKKGKLKRADAVVFVRFDDYDTQFQMPSGVQADPAGDRTAWTFGISFYPVPNLVIKSDVQVLNHATDGRPAAQINFGIGWDW